MVVPEQAAIRIRNGQRVRNERSAAPLSAPWRSSGMLHSAIFGQGASLRQVFVFLFQTGVGGLEQLLQQDHLRTVFGRKPHQIFGFLDEFIRIPAARASALPQRSGFASRPPVLRSLPNPCRFQAALQIPRTWYGGMSGGHDFIGQII